MASMFTRILDRVRGYDLEDDFEEYYDEFDEGDEDNRDSYDEIEFEEPKGGLFRRQSKVVDFNKPSNVKHQVVIVEPASIEAAQEVCDHLRSNITVICNFEKVDQKIAQRVMDFITGSAYAIDGKVHKISGMIFVTVPKNVSISDANHPLSSSDYEGASSLFAAR